MNEIVKCSKELYHEIDDCITNLIKAVLDKDTNKENEAICCMESLLVSTIQNLSWMVGELKGCSKIKWHTGEPKKEGKYVVSLLGGRVMVDELYSYEYIKGSSSIIEFAWRCNFFDDVIAWCKLSDIKPYKEE